MLHRALPFEPTLIRPMHRTTLLNEEPVAAAEFHNGSLTGWLPFGCEHPLAGNNAPRGDDYDARWSAWPLWPEYSWRSGSNRGVTRESGGARVLDAGCGTGRVAVELAARGFSMVGVDADSGMLTTARAKLPEVEWIEADLSEVGGASTASSTW